MITGPDKERFYRQLLHYTMGKCCQLDEMAVLLNVGVM